MKNLIITLNIKKHFRGILLVLFPFLIFLFFLPVNLPAQTPVDYAIQGIPFNTVSLNDGFWLPKIETNRTITIPSSFQKCEETGRVENFILASGAKKGKFLTVYPFDDTDIYKTIEGAAFSMTVHPDKALDRYVDSLIAIVAAAQEPDGYLYTARTIDPAHPHDWSGSERWVKESELSHELYNSGHLFEAAAAHFIATGKRNLLNIALKNANLLVQVFGPGKRDDAPGHEIVEMGLVRLYRITGEKKYLDLAKFFIDCRGKIPNSKQFYSQNHIPFVQQTEAVGHAVRAAYLYSGVADVAALTGNKEYIDAIDKIWENTVTKKFYITGGIGALHAGEAFGADYELPNLTAYNETCAAIANVYWNYRMFLLHGDAKYIDVLERSLYNNVISGIGLDGKTFFYPNPLESNAKYAFNYGNKLSREPWFDCSCCPTNLCRFMASVPGYIYAQKQEDIYVNLFIGSKTTFKLQKTSVVLSQQSNYPWEGNVSIQVNPTKKTDFSLCLRIPGWARNQPVPGDLYRYVASTPEEIVVKVNGKAVAYTTREGYAVISRQWKKGDKVEYTLPMNIHRVEANEKVKDDRGKIAIERGPVVYCLEGIDNNNNLNTIILPDNAPLSVKFQPAKLNGINEISGEAIVLEIATDGLSVQTKKQPFTAIPYYAWSNRGINQMKVWLPRKVKEITISNE
ncbi:MAG TPA: glycoside hydrolase family 127 protein [Paludibacteraceae bacterium]|nr:glycoside hydrolase family 127 protein [Paludibacteraceae bacterium]